MKYFFRFIIAISFIFCCCNFSCLKNTFIRQGVIQRHEFYINFNDSTQLLYTNMENNIWFQDSCVIVEMKKVNNYFSNDSFVKRSYDFYKYTYFDLRSMTCQDYHNFSDTALPFTNYFLKPDEVLTSCGKFYGEKRPSDFSNNIVNLPDTIIQSKVYKRIKMLFENRNGGNSFEYICYMDCFEKTIFHLNRTTDDNYPECQVTKTSIRRDLNSALTTIFEYNLLRKELSEKEKKVFSKWSKNAKETKLPLITYMEALKISVDMDKKN